MNKGSLFTSLYASLFSSCMSPETFYEEHSSFETLGPIPAYYRSGITDMQLGDIDGDGDLDIIVLDTNYNVIRIYENKIPQKQ